MCGSAWFRLVRLLTSLRYAISLLCSSCNSSYSRRKNSQRISKLFSSKQSMKLRDDLRARSTQTHFKFSSISRKTYGTGSRFAIFSTSIYSRKYLFACAILQRRAIDHNLVTCNNELLSSTIQPIHIHSSMTQKSLVFLKFIHENIFQVEQSLYLLKSTFRLKLKKKGKIIQIFT